MVYYIINGIGIITLCYFQYKRYKLIKDIKTIDYKKTYRFDHGTWTKEGVDRGWKVFLILKEDGKSTNKKMTKFIVEKVISENSKDTASDFENYTQHFYGSTGGGWVNSKSEKLLEYEPTSIWEQRNKKLEALGIK